MGGEAAELVLQAIRGKEQKPHLRRTRPELVVRMSTASPPPALTNRKNGRRGSR
jgi:DNA-binding LacI/PurR family transcriptional regulator